ncbi:MAG TPA: transport-associated protein, partial [Candidatus Angelobacter sp.]|nr:transport-associated protein [Candidatus Angelobacter sp.]
MKKAFEIFLASVLALGATAGFARSNDQAQALSANGQQRITKEVRHELVMIPQYTIFDNLAYRVDGDTVTLFGQVRNAVIKDEAEKDV